MLAQITCSHVSVQNAFQKAHSCFSEVKYQVETPTKYHSSYEAGNGRFQNLYNGRLLAHLGAKRQSLEEAFERVHDPPHPSRYSEVASLDRCTLLLREATRALQGGYLTAWVHRFIRGEVPLVVKVKKQLEDMAKIDAEQYGPAFRELCKEDAPCSEEYSDAVMDAVISLVVEMQFPGGMEEDTILLNGS